MIYKYLYSFDHDREYIKNYLISIKNNDGRIIDVGSSIKSNFEVNDFISEFRDVTVDLHDLPSSKMHFKGNINLFSTWLPILNHVSEHGKFDFCYASHILEDISNPIMVCNIMSCIAKEGFIAVPSKYIESSKISGNDQYRGYLHHRWIFNVESNKLIGYPKISFVEYEKFSNELANSLNEYNQELQIYWKDSIELNSINNDFLGPDVESIKKYYLNLLN